MTQGTHALILTGDLLPGFAADQVWPALAAHFRIEPRRLHDEVLSRAPLVIKEGGDRAQLLPLHEAATRLGAVVELHALDADGQVFVLIDNTPRGPLPRGFVAARMAAGVWPSTLRVAAVGSTQWTSFAAPTMPPPAPPASVAPAMPDAGTGSDGDRLMQGERLPAGIAIHAGFWRRCAAYLIDQLILFVPGVLVSLFPLLGIVLVILGQWLYFALLESSASQATLGKLAMGLKATDDHGRRLGFGQATGRYFAGALSVLSLYVGYMLAGWTARKQALHDLVAGTCVVFREVEPGRPLPTVRAPMPWYGWLANVGLLSVFPLSILAAVSVPAYHDYVTRSKVVAVAAAIAPLKIEGAEALMQADAACPHGARTVANALVESVVFAGDARRCSIVVTFASDGEVPSALRGQTIEWVHRDGGRWQCSSSVVDKLLPAECR